MRKETLLNDDWSFETEGMPAKRVDLPHTWNGEDGQDGGNDYVRCTCVYKKIFPRPELAAGEVCKILFCGVNSEAEVFFNGEKVCRHEGGYSSFVADVTKYLRDENELEVRVSNEPNESVYPQKADFTFYGGIYRDVKLLVLPEDRFDFGPYCSPSLKATATVRGGDGILVVEAYTAGEGEVKLSVFDKEGNVVAQGRPGEELIVENAHLWNGVKDPFLYTVEAELIKDGAVVDRAGCNVGFRYFSVDPKQGFFLNGNKYPLRGVCRHQDRPKKGNAISARDHEEDAALIREIGANTIRLAHYQHDAYFYDLCDRYGFVVWAEIPYISKHMPTANENTQEQMRELILQNYNHPSICIWGVSNEITMYRADKKDVVANHKKLNELCHALDPNRLTTLACFSVCAPWNKTAHITDVVSWNMYFGWYFPGKFMNKVWYRFFRMLYPKRCVGMSEYGAEAMPNLHSLHPRRGDNTEEYQANYHEYMAKLFDENDYFWATHVWNMFDFAADARNQGGEPGMNHKGLVTFDRKTKKDAFYVYKAYWSDEPFVHICGSRFVNRTGRQLKVKVYSNLETVSLYCNGKLAETKKGSKVFEFTLPMSEINELEARSGNVKDSIVVCHVKKKDPAYIEKNLGSSYSWQTSNANKTNKTKM